MTERLVPREPAAVPEGVAEALAEAVVASGPAALLGTVGKAVGGTDAPVEGAVPLDAAMETEVGTSVVLVSASIVESVEGSASALVSEATVDPLRWEVGAVVVSEVVAEPLVGTDIVREGVVVPGIVVEAALVTESVVGSSGG